MLDAILRCTQHTNTHRWFATQQTKHKQNENNKQIIKKKHEEKLNRVHIAKIKKVTTKKHTNQIVHSTLLPRHNYRYFLFVFSKVHSLRIFRDALALRFIFALFTYFIFFIHFYCSCYLFFRLFSVLLLLLVNCVANVNEIGERCDRNETLRNLFSFHFSDIL